MAKENSYEKHELPGIWVEEVPIFIFKMISRGRALFGLLKIKKGIQK